MERWIFISKYKSIVCTPLPPSLIKGDDVFQMRSYRGDEIFFGKTEEWYYRGEGGEVWFKIGDTFFDQLSRENVWQRECLFLINFSNCRSRIWIWFVKYIKHWFAVGM